MDVVFVASKCIILTFYHLNVWEWARRDKWKGREVTHDDGRMWPIDHTYCHVKHSFAP